jgi:hypothetical protein
VSAGPSGERVKDAVHTVLVQAVFHVNDDQQARTVAAKMVDRTHEIANSPECECDVDVSVEMTPAPGFSGAPAPGGAPPRGRTSES